MVTGLLQALQTANGQGIKPYVPLALAGSSVYYQVLPVIQSTFGVNFFPKKICFLEDDVV
jgi:hypothetical protein